MTNTDARWDWALEKTVNDALTIDTLFDAYNTILKQGFKPEILANGYQVEYERDANGELVLVTPSSRRPIINPNDISSSRSPKNNDDRVTCYWCNAPTKSLDTGMSGDIRVCTKCGK